MDVRSRCRVGLHKWVQIRETDADLDNPSASAEWRTVCRHCNTERSSGVLFSGVLFGTVLLAGLVLFWFAPLLGSIIIVAAAGGLLVAVGPASIERVARWLSR